LIARLLNLDLDIVFVDTTSSYWEVVVADELAAALAEDPADNGGGRSAEAGVRSFGHSRTVAGSGTAMLTSRDLPACLQASQPWWQRGAGGLCSSVGR